MKVCVGAMLAAEVTFMFGRAEEAGASNLAGAAARVRAPMVCSRGSGEFVAVVVVPASATRDSRYTVRVDGTPSEKLSHFGLNYIHDMVTEFALPAGATYVPGSARIVAGTGTPNVTTTAQVTSDGAVVRLALPAHVASGSSYTPPSIELELQAAAPPGTSLPFAFSQYRVTANAFLVGDVHATCETIPKHYTLGTTLVTPAPVRP